MSPAPLFGNLPRWTEAHDPPPRDTPTHAMLQATAVMSALLVWGGVHSDAFLMPGGGGAPSAWIERTRPSSVRAAAMMRAGAPLAACTAARASTISALLQSAPPPEGFEWGYDSSAGADAGADAGGSPEELLLKAIEALREQDLEGARELLAQARSACERAGGPTDDQASLLELVAGRLSSAAAPSKRPRPPPAGSTGSIGGAPTTRWDANLGSDASMAEINFPGTSAAPTGNSLIMPGTPTMAELSARMDEKRRVAAAARAEAARAEQRGAEAPPAGESEGDTSSR